MEALKRRFVGIDLGKRTYTMAIIGKKGGVTMSNGKTDIGNRPALLKKLEKTDKVTLEAGNLAFEIAKEIIEQEGFRGCGFERFKTSTHLWFDEEDRQRGRSKTGEDYRDDER